ncbi:MAG: thioredoxin domain-containing protein, partial [Planctomycetota bacterium]|jgi:uncharacterized protein YyaL (SSP411 family)
MNEGFVNIKVDREERPDLDELYMRAVQLMTGTGGWPLTMFLTPDLVPFYGGTYFPPQDEAGSPGFPRVLHAVREAYLERRDEVRSSTREVLKAIEKTSAPPEAEGELSDELLEHALRAISGQFDMEQGGFGIAPKFPQAPCLDFLLRLWCSSGDDRAALMLNMTLEKVAAGGIFDQLGGGFHRYAVDREWRVPHFEKMLYDNALLAGLYADASRALHREDYRAIAIGAGEYALRELRGPEGAFYAAQDADSEGVEGQYYLWTYAEIVDCLGERDAEVVACYLGAVEEGNWEEGKNVLHRAMAVHRLADLFNLEEAEAEAMVERGMSRLLEARDGRVPPETDRKVLTDWNALMVTGLTRLHRAAPEGGYLGPARQCADFLLVEMFSDGALLHAWCDGLAGPPGFLSDHALLCAALLDLHESTFDVTYLRAARDVAAVIVEDYWDAEVGLFDEVGARNERLVAPVRTASDQPVPSGSSAACDALLRLFSLGGPEEYGEIAGRVLEGSLALMQQSALGTGRMLSAALRYLSEARELVIVGLEGAGARSLRATADEFCLPHLVRVGARSAEVLALSDEIPLLQGKQAVDGKPTAFLCSGGTCREPAREPQELRRQLESLRPKRRWPSVPL